MRRESWSSSKTPNSPTPAPLVHLIVYALAGNDGELTEGAASSERPAVPLGHNSFGKNAWLPCDPPPGHGDHRYVFQVFALDAVPDLGEHPGRGAVVDALAQACRRQGCADRDVRPRRVAGCRVARYVVR